MMRKEKGRAVCRVGPGRHAVCRVGPGPHPHPPKPACSRVPSGSIFETIGKFTSAPSQRADRWPPEQEAGSAPCRRPLECRSTFDEGGNASTHPWSRCFLFGIVQSPKWGCTACCRSADGALQLEDRCLADPLGWVSEWKPALQWVSVAVPAKVSRQQAPTCAWHGGDPPFPGVGMGAGKSMLIR